MNATVMKNVASTTLTVIRKGVKSRFWASGCRATPSMNFDPATPSPIPAPIAPPASVIAPTGETAQFVLAGDDLAKRLEVQRMLSSGHWFVREHVLWVEPVRVGEPVMSGRLVLDPEIVEALTTDTVSTPRFSTEFPAERIDTAMDWDDLVLNPRTSKQIREIEHWVTHNDTLLREWDMGRRLKPGYRALFHGPPGTGKTLTATLLGKQTARDVFRIDLSRMVSKYIGETEKNLSRLFDKAENKDWILFFDEADALFGKRTDIRDAHDKYANQEAAYLLQRIETYGGLVILATNQRGNIDDAFLRRFQAAIHFPCQGPMSAWRSGVAPFPRSSKLPTTSTGQTSPDASTDRCRDRQHSPLLRAGGARGRVAPRRPQVTGGSHTSRVHERGQGGVVDAPLRRHAPWRPRN
jgi:hypothetical protein